MENKILIALDDGHGIETPGKRTPEFEDGTFMHENEFNRIVVKYLKEHLEYNNFDVLEVAPTDEDIPLTTRVKLANNQILNKFNKYADFYLSVHANAYGNGEWNEVSGIETYVHFDYPETVKKAEIINKHILKGTPLKNRGVKNGDWIYVLKYTLMEAVLVELAFMTNKNDAKLLMSDEYRRESAKELAQAICEIYNVPFKEKVVKQFSWLDIILKLLKSVFMSKMEN